METAGFTPFFVALSNGTPGKNHPTCDRFLEGTPNPARCPTRTASATRIEFPTRTCRSSPRLHNAYTVAVQTPKYSATSFNRS